MPLLSIETNTPLPANTEGLTAELSAAMAEWLGKPEDYVMVRLRHNPDMRFSGTAEPMAYCEMKSIGLPEGRTAELSRALCERLEQRLAIAPDRVYIEFTDAPRRFWGWNGATF
jgi:phenylpyruvate tautomerase